MTEFYPQTRKEISKIQWHPIEALPTKYGQNNSYYNVVNFVKKLKQWINTRGQSESKQSKTKPKTKNKSDSTPDAKPFKDSPISTQKTKTISAKNKIKLPKSASNAQDIFDKLRMKNDNSPVNSVLMRDNPSPIHLFEKLSSEKPAETTDDSVLEPKEKLVKAIEVFASSLKTLKVNRSVIRESVNKTF